MSLQQQNHSAAVHMLAESMHPNNNNNNYPSMEVDINSKATGTDDVKLAALVDVDPDFKRVSQNKKVQHFLDDLQTIHITETIKSMSLVFAATWQLLFCPLLGMLIVFS